MMPQHLLCFPYSVTYNLRHSVLHPPSPVHLSVLRHSITLSPLFPSSIFHHSHHFFPSPCLPTPCLSIPFYYYLSNICSLLLASPFRLHLSYILSLVTLSHFLHSLYYPVCCPTPSLVVYKSFRLVVYP